MPLLKGRVLFIGDDLSISKPIVKIINRSGCQTKAVSRKKAINLLSQQDYDCILVDWIMLEDRDWRSIIKCSRSPHKAASTCSRV